MISRDELISAVWKNRVVSDDAINRCISILRQTLSPQDTHAYIETVTRRGYIAHFPSPPAETAPDAKSPPRWRIPLLAIAASVALLSLYLLIAKDTEDSRGHPASLRAEPPVVAVLPFSVYGKGDEGSFFADGMHEDLLTQLAQLQAFRVISRTSVLEYRDSSQNLREIGRELGADAILEGGVQGMGDQVRFNVQLIDTSSDEHLWAETYDRELSPESLFAVQSEIARAVAAAMHTSLTTEDASKLAVLPTQNMAAYRAFHRAMEIRDSLGVDNPSYIEALEEAVALDPDFTRAWAELAGMLSFQSFTGPDPETIQRVEQILEQIHTVAPDSADYMIAQVYYTYYLVKNYEKALQMVLQVQALRPSDVRVLELKSYIQRRLGDFEGRSESFRMAAKLDPRNPHWTTVLIRNLVISHRYAEASRALEASPFERYETSILGSMLRQQGHRDFEQWVVEVEALQSEYEDSANLLDLWEALVAARDFVAALGLIQAMPLDLERNDGSTFAGLSNSDVARALTYWFLEQDEPLNDLLIRMRSELDELRNPNGSVQRVSAMLGGALLAVLEGNTAEAERQIRRWQRVAPSDLAELATQRHHACRMLGMAGATAATVECIRATLVKPSYAMPFIEPFLPYYDSIRAEQAFVDLLAELEPAD